MPCFKLLHVCNNNYYYMQLLQWLVPTLVVIGVGIVVSISIPISGCCFLICRRHNACCARKHEALLLPCHTLKCFLGLCLTLLCSILLLWVSHNSYTQAISDIHSKGLPLHWEFSAISNPPLLYKTSLPVCSALSGWAWSTSMRLLM